MRRKEIGHYVLFVELGHELPHENKRDSQHGLCPAHWRRLACFVHNSKVPLPKQLYTITLTLPSLSSPHNARVEISRMWHSLHRFINRKGFFLHFLRFLFYSTSIACRCWYVYVTTSILPQCSLSLHTLPIFSQRIWIVRRAQMWSKESHIVISCVWFFRSVVFERIDEWISLDNSLSSSELCVRERRC